MQQSILWIPGAGEGSDPVGVCAPPPPPRQMGYKNDLFEVIVCIVLIVVMACAPFVDQASSPAICVCVCVWGGGGGVNKMPRLILGSWVCHWQYTPHCMMELSETDKFIFN